MLHHPTLDKLQALRLHGMYHALVEQMQMPEIATLSFEERLGLLVDRELTEREDRRLTTRLRQAKLRQAACLEDLDYRQPRGLDKALMTTLATCQWIRDRHNVLITGPTGIAKLGSLALWANRPAVKALQPSTSACPGSCRSGPLPRGMDAT